jgi:hypothetical protein
VTADLDIRLQFDFLTPLPVIAGFMRAIHDELGGGIQFMDVQCIDGLDLHDGTVRFTVIQVTVRAVAPWVRARRRYPCSV